MVVTYHIQNLSLTDLLEKILCCLPVRYELVSITILILSCSPIKLDAQSILTYMPTYHLS